MNFQRLRDLSPSAFKLYVYFLEKVRTTHRPVLKISLADLGFESGLQPSCPYPALRHGRDGQLRRALKELKDKGLIEKQGQRGRSPNTYRLVTTERRS